jgi:hypothetical protein
MTSIAKWLSAGAGVAATAYGATVGLGWLRYGRPKRATGAAMDPLLDSFMPTYDVCERHAIATDAPADITLAAAKAMDLEDSRIVRTIFKARELILRARPAIARPRGLHAGMQAIGWGVLAETEREVVFGAVTKPWEPDPVFRAVPPAAFAGFSEPDHVKIVWTLRADPAPGGGSTFRTETRAIATDERARTKFRRYWAFLSPGIILIRIAMLPALRAAAEAAWRIDGDDIIPDPRAQFTHTIAIAAPPRDVWPWLVQMGCQRAGWYSWDALDNAGVRSADRIIPELQRIAAGDVLPYRPTGSEGFEVLRVEPQRALVLGSTTPDFHGTWAFVLEALGDHATRLVTRYRAAYDPSLKMAVTKPWMASLHAFMERKQLRTIKDHAERLYAAEAHTDHATSAN